MPDFDIYTEDVEDPSCAGVTLLPPMAGWMAGPTQFRSYRFSDGLGDKALNQNVVRGGEGRRFCAEHGLPAVAHVGGAQSW